MSKKSNNSAFKLKANSKLPEDPLEPPEILLKIYEYVRGTGLLLEEIQPDWDGTTNLPKDLEARKNFAFKTLIATILSVRTKDETTLKVIEELWKHYNTPEKLANAPLEEVERIIYSTGSYHQKALRIIETARIIHEKFNDEVPSDMEDLLSLPGVGRKVANCVRSVSFNIPSIAVDTHVHRISNRLGWVKTKDPHKTEEQLSKIFPEKYWNLINYSLVSFGKKVCKPSRPLCGECPVEKHCPKIIEIAPKKSKRKKNKK